jgi:hypothetical protein
MKMTRSLVPERKSQLSSTFPVFTPAMMEKYYPSRLARRGFKVNTEYAMRHWAWIANSYRYRGYDLGRCVREANKSVYALLREKKRREKYAPTKTKRWKKRRRKANAPERKPKKRQKPLSDAQKHARLMAGRFRGLNGLGGMPRRVIPARYRKD